MKKDEVEEFISRRFPVDCNWLDGNCYYFAVILKDRFPEGKICYDVIYGHFVFVYNKNVYDWRGINKETDGVLIDWNQYQEYDELHANRIKRDVIL